MALRLPLLISVEACSAMPRQSGPATSESSLDQPNDPAEPANRAIFGVNRTMDRYALRPVAVAYRDNVPGAIRRGLHNFTENLGEPRVLVNDLLQGNIRRAWNTTQRFVVNSAAGGLFDVASDAGLPRHEADFGQTFGVWGVDPGPAVQLPLLDPSNARDSVGTVLGFIADPLGRIPGSTMSTISYAGAVVGAIDGRSRTVSATDDLEKNSLDYYATLRSVSAQRRAALVQDGLAGSIDIPQASTTPAPKGEEPGRVPAR